MIDIVPALPAGLLTLPVTTPDGAHAQAAIIRSEGRTQARLDDLGEPGVYRFRLPDPPGGSAFATVAADSRESDLRRLIPRRPARSFTRCRCASNLTVPR